MAGMPKSVDSDQSVVSSGYTLFAQTFLLQCLEPGRIAQSVGLLTRKSGVLGSIPGLATYFRFSFLLFQDG